MRKHTQRTGQKKASAILNPPNKNPSSASPSAARRSFVLLRASPHKSSIFTISICAAAEIGTLPVYRARKFAEKAPRSAEKPECICAAALRASALSWRSRGQRGSSGLDSARNSQMASESLIVVEPSERHWRSGTNPVGETLLT